METKEHITLYIHLIIDKMAIDMNIDLSYLLNKNS